MNENWIRWIFSSISNHFSENKGTLNLFIEGNDRLQDQKEGAELSINGPYFRNISKKSWMLDIEIIILINTMLNDQDIYKVKRQQGLFSKLYTPIINVYKYGDNDEYLGCLILKTDGQDDIIVENLGQISPDIRIVQSAISATYRIELQEN